MGYIQIFASYHCAKKSLGDFFQDHRIFFSRPREFFFRPREFFTDHGNFFQDRGNFFPENLWGQQIYPSLIMRLIKNAPWQRLPKFNPPPYLPPPWWWDIFGSYKKRFHDWSLLDFIRITNEFPVQGKLPNDTLIMPFLFEVQPRTYALHTFW